MVKLQQADSVGKKQEEQQRRGLETSFSQGASAEPPPPPRQLYDDGVLAVVAGSDTTSSALTSVFNCLLTHPEAYARLQEEVDQFYPAGEDAFSTKHHRGMHYLQAVMYGRARTTVLFCRH